MAIKGIDLSKFHEKQRMAIEILAQPGRGGMTLDEVAKYIHADPKTLFRWRGEPEFVNAVTQKAIMNLHADLPEVFAANMERAKAGEVRSVDLVYKLLGLLVDKSEIEVKENGKSEEEIDTEIRRMREKLKEQGY